MKKVLVVDDSAVMRKLISDIIIKEPNVSVVDTVENGALVVRLLQEQQMYDLIVLDIKMPELDGVGVLEFMNRNRYRIPTLIVSSEASKSKVETMMALELGAYDFVKKPGVSKQATVAEFSEQIRERVQCGLRMTMEADFAEGEKAYAAASVKKNKGEQIVLKGKQGGTIIFIASSTGGPKALQSVIPAFPENIGCPVVVVQHMPEGFTASLAARLNELSKCRVKEAEHEEILKNGVVYIAKGGCQLRVKAAGTKGHQLVLDRDAPRNGLRPCADICLESLVETGYQRVICAVLTGMGSDGTNGLLKLKEVKEVYTVGQNQKSCVVYGMPRAAVQAGLVDVVVDLADVGNMLTKMVM